MFRKYRFFETKNRLFQNSTVILTIHQRTPAILGSAEVHRSSPEFARVFPEINMRTIVEEYDSTVTNLDGAVETNAEIDPYPCTWKSVRQAFGIGADKTRLMARNGMGFLRSQTISSDAELLMFTKLFLWTRKGSNGGRGNPFTPKAFLHMRFQDETHPGYLDQKLREVGIHEQEIQQWFEQARNLLKVRV